MQGWYPESTGKSGIHCTEQVWHGGIIFGEYRPCGYVTDGSESVYIDDNQKFNLATGVEYEANRIDSAGYDIYGIALDMTAGSEGYNVMQKVGKDGFYSASPADLQSIYNKLAGSILQAGRNASVRDVIGEKFTLLQDENHPITVNKGSVSYDSATHTLNWTGIEALNATVATLTYYVRIDSQLPKGVYDTNEEAFLTYTDLQNNTQSKEFPKPKVPVGSGSIQVIYQLVNAAGVPIDQNGNVVGQSNIAQSYLNQFAWLDNGSAELVLQKEYAVTADATYGKDGKSYTLRSDLTPQPLD